MMHALADIGAAFLAVLGLSNGPWAVLSLVSVICASLLLAVVRLSAHIQGIDRVLLLGMVMALAWLGWQAFNVKVPLAAKLFLMFFAAFSIRRFMVPAIEGRA